MNTKEIQNVIEAVVQALQNAPKRQNDTSIHATPALSFAIPVELSARHVHLSENDALALFGAPLTPVRELSQHGQYLCKERVRLIGPKGVLDNVAVLGPARSQSQVELSQTDARTLGVSLPIRQSGDLEQTPSLILASSSSLIALKHGAIIAARHIHMSPEDAVRFGVKDTDTVKVRLSTERPVVLEDVIVRVHPSFSLAMHIDSDEGNSASWNKGTFGIIVQ